LCWLASVGAPALASQSSLHASAASTSRWWKLACGDERTPCTFTVKLHGAIDDSRLHLLRRALERRDQVQRRLQREVELRVDVDSQGGSVFTGMEIGRILREQRSSITVRDGASCVSACVFLLMGATERSVGDTARVAIHRPSLGRSGADATVAAMADSLALYAQQMNLSRAIVDAMMAIPADRLRFVSRSDLAGFGIPARRD
jgi:hypothetical protein